MSHSLSLYLHIPFCMSKCTYCAFNTYTRLEHLIPPFVEAMLAELRCCAVGAGGRTVHTVFLGGGTPSLLQAEQLADILRTINLHFNVCTDVEVTLEANPNDLNREWLAAAFDAGVNRLSIGVQSTQARDLRLFARRHDNDQVAQAVLNARQAGFGLVNLDLIYGVPEQGLTDWERTLAEVLLLKPGHLSLYALSLEAGTPLQEWVARGEVAAPDDDLAADQYELASEVLAAAGYRQYEISNWALAGQECRHNLQYWRNLDWLGLGPGAHGHVAGTRTRTCLSPREYIEALKGRGECANYPATPATEEVVHLTREERISETLIMGLRLTEEGIGRDEFSRRFGEDVTNIFGDELRAHERRGLLEIRRDRIRLRPAGRLLANQVFRDLV
ncbi:MAG: radical SAM family heme chaperone HemW [Anaerolineaceae bacterium]|nr:radical SAM family heme chaperone HemW [Anaerolineaceae bacterium]